MARMFAARISHLTRVCGATEWRRRTALEYDHVLYLSILEFSSGYMGRNYYYFYFITSRRYFNKQIIIPDKPIRPCYLGFNRSLKLEKIFLWEFYYFIYKIAFFKL